MADRSTPRLESLDALRGLDAALIIGLGTAMWHVYTACPSEFWYEVRYHMGHAAWEGLRVYDLIFPLFVFLAGLSMNFSVRKRLGMGASTARLLLHLWWRALLLVIFGILVNGPLIWDADAIRCASVLGLIGISGALAGSIVLVIKKTWGILIVAALIPVCVFLMQYLGGDMTITGCYNAKVDAAICPGKLHYTHIDPEGPLCILSATALSLGGYLIGRLFSGSITNTRRIVSMLGIGAAAISLGHLGPCIKNIWTPCFVLLSFGISTILMAIFHLVIDVWKFSVWAWAFKIVGHNALFIYLVTHVVAFGELTNRIFGGTIAKTVPQDWVGFTYGIAYFLLAWLLCLLLYKHRIFVKV